MTLPNEDRDLLMLAPSFSLSPVAPVLSALSLPVGYQQDLNVMHPSISVHSSYTPSMCYTTVHSVLEVLGFQSHRGHIFSLHVSSFPLKGYRLEGIIWDIYIAPQRTTFEPLHEGVGAKTA